jgi:hypothetical protein
MKLPAFPDLFNLSKADLRKTSKKEPLRCVTPLAGMTIINET